MTAAQLHGVEDERLGILDPRIQRVLGPVLDERRDRLGLIPAALLAGSVGGAVALAVADHVAASSSRGIPLRLGELVSGGALDPTAAQVAAFAIAALLGALFAVPFALLTRRLRKLGPLLAWNVIAVTAVWTFLDAFLLPAVSPSWVGTLTFVETLPAVIAFACIASLQLPLRRRSGSVD